jgi:hypothetical protein
MPTVTYLPVSDPEPRRSVRDQDESLTGYLARIGQQAPPASAKTTTRALAHYTSELADLTRDRRHVADMPLTTADGQKTASVAEIYWAGWADCANAMAAALEPHLRVVTLDDSTAASVTAIRELAG